MLKFRENEEAVSPVIGVILMVAITVILAAVIAAFAFGMTDSLAPPKEVYVTTKLVDEDSTTHLCVTLQGGKDVRGLENIDALGNDNEVLVRSDTVTPPFKVGDTVKFPLTEAHQKIVIRGHFSDNTVAILADTSYNPTGEEEE